MAIGAGAIRPVVSGGVRWAKGSVPARAERSTAARTSARLHQRTSSISSLSMAMVSLSASARQPIISEDG